MLKGHKLFTNQRGHKMKLEMTAYDLDIQVEINGDDTFNNSLEVMAKVKELIEELASFEDVNISIVSVAQDEDDDEEEDDNEEDDEEASVENNASWPYPENGLDDQGAEVVPFIEPEKQIA